MKMMLCIWDYLNLLKKFALPSVSALMRMTRCKWNFCVLVKCFYGKQNQHYDNVFTSCSLIWSDNNSPDSLQIENITVCQNKPEREREIIQCTHYFIKL